MIINIIGRGEGYEQGYEAEGEKWGINYFHPSLDVLFEIHPVGHPFHEKLARERENAKAAGIVLIDQKSWHFKDLRKYLRQNKLDYLGSSADWTIGIAIRWLHFMKGPNEIHLWGVTMDDKGDHYEKRCATDFWCGVAIGRGIKVVVHGNSRVMTTEDGKIYGLFTPMARQYISDTVE